MVTTASITLEEIAAALKELFSNANKNDKKYAEIWLNGVDFGGLYDTDLVVVNISAAYELESCNEELKFIGRQLFPLLDKKVHSKIWRVALYNYSEDVHCDTGEMLVYMAEDICV